MIQSIQHHYICCDNNPTVCRCEQSFASIPTLKQAPDIYISIIYSDIYYLIHDHVNELLWSANATILSVLPFEENMNIIEKFSMYINFSGFSFKVSVFVQT